MSQSATHVIFCLYLTSLADQEACNTPYVVGSGVRYAKCFPSERYGTNGTTRIYFVDAEKDVDKLEYTYDWYSPREVAFLQWGFGLSVVRFGSWPGGDQASSNIFAMAFYGGTELLASYSTLDLAERSDNVRETVSHYTAIKKVHGYRWIRSNDYVFEIETIDGRILVFDIANGKLIATKKHPN